MLNRLILAWGTMLNFWNRTINTRLFEANVFPSKKLFVFNINKGVYLVNEARLLDLTYVSGLLDQR